MHLYSTRVFERQSVSARTVRGPRETGVPCKRSLLAGVEGRVLVRGVEVRGLEGRGMRGAARLRAAAALMLGLMAGMPSGFAQQPAPAAAQDQPGTKNKDASNLPSAPTPAPTEPLSLRQTERDFSRPSGPLLGNPINTYRGTTVPVASFSNSARLDDLVKDGKIYLSLSDAIALAIENNYDIAIAALQPRHRGYRHPALEGGIDPARRQLGCGIQHAGRGQFDADGGRRPGRDVGWIGRSGFRPRRTGILDQQCWSVAGVARSLGWRDHPVGTRQGAAVEHPLLRWQVGADHQHQHLQLHL